MACDQPVPDAASIVILPIVVNDSVPEVFLASWSTPRPRASHMFEVPEERHRPTFELLCRHLEHMLRNTALLDDLAQTQRRLVAARDQLEDRVELRTRELRLEIGERERAEAQLIIARDAAEAGSRAKSAFLANMSHELRTPLNAIIGYAELVGEDAVASGRAEILPDLQKISAAGRHLLRLVNDVLDLSKIEAGKLAIACEPFDVTACLHSVVTTAQALVRKNRNVLEVSACPGLGVVVGDETHVAQVLLNLLGNAAKFTEGGTIQLSVRRESYGEAGALVFEVSDTGIGMPADRLESIFADFAQADSSTTRRFGGTGLGLAISRRLSRLMGGDITVESIEGRGSVFTFRLPVTSPDPDALVPATTHA
jgi:signal transduction histidine kinase